MNTNATPKQKFAKFEQFFEFAEKHYMNNRECKASFPSACSKVAFQFTQDVPASRSKLLADAKRAMGLAEKFASSSAWTAADTRMHEALRLLRSVSVDDFRK